MQVEIVDLSSVPGVQDSLCYGIARTNQMADKKAAEYHTDQTLHVYFHLPAGSTAEQKARTEDTLRRRYIKMAPDTKLVEKIDEVPDNVPFVMGTRGASPQTRDEVARRVAAGRLEVIMDTTCPYVSTQEAAARKLLEEGYQLVFCGLPEYHGLPRLRGLAAVYGKEIHVTHRPEDVARLPFKRVTRIGVILQTTWHMSLAKDAIAELVSTFREVRVMDTSCIDSLARVPAARRIAEESDVVVLVDIGKVARYLEEEIEETARRTGGKCATLHRIENKTQLRPEWFSGAQKVSILGGINVHRTVLDDVASVVRGYAG
jgi:4-hydroxy-3-methylbut-2-enyl diphosphate reductase